MSAQKPSSSLQKQIVATFVILAVVALGSITVATGIFVGVIGNTASSQTSDALENQVQQDMIGKINRTAMVIGSNYDHVINDLDGLAQATNDIFKNPSEFSDRKSYYHVDFLPKNTYLFDNSILAINTSYPQNQPYDIQYNAGLKLNVSSSYSAYLIYQNTYNLMGGDVYNLTGSHGLIINRSAQLDPMMSQILKNNSQYAWIYLEFEQGIQRTFPWSGTDFDIFRTTTNPTGIDYKTEDWYKNAKIAGGKVVFSEPYVDTYLGAIVTCSRAIYNGSAFLGVVAIDMTLQTISNTVGNIKMYKTGYGFLIDNQGSIIAHPDIQYGKDLEEISVLSDVEPEVKTTVLSAVQTNMTQGKTGFIEIAKEFPTNTTKYYLGYAPVKSANFSLGVFVPVEEVLTPVRTLQSQLAIQIAIQITILLVLFGIVLAVILVVGIKVSKRVIHPIQRLSEVAIKLSTEDIHKTLSSDVNIDTEFGQVEAEAEETEEIGDLMNAFKTLVKKVREEDQAKK